MASFKQFSNPGDVYLTRNIDSLNKTPGYWQHCAISTGWAVVEAQAEPGCVIMVLEECFRRRNPERILLRRRGSTDLMNSHLATCAQARLGTPYNARFANCVTLVRNVYNEALGSNYRWLSPNGLFRESDFLKIEWFKDYENWKQPADWYEGRIA